MLALFAICWLLPVVIGCCWLSSIESSTDLAQAPVATSTFAHGPRSHAAPQKELHSPCLGATLLPVLAKLRRRLRVVIYARYSTEEQDASSIEDQVQYCKDFLATIGITDPIITIYRDEGVSGELRNRPGIDNIWRGINEPEWDLLIVEDCSRLFRNASACIEMVEIAFDAGMRFVAINDDVDTTEEGWHDRLREAAGDHAKANYFLRRRLQRKMIALWRMGAAVSMLKPGYKRRPTVPATMGERAKGPSFDEIDEKWSRIVCECFERIANGDPSWLVAKWLTEVKLPKFENSRLPEWTDAEVNGLIRQTVYRGLDRHRREIVTQKKRTGKKSMVANEGDCWTRGGEHLRIVPDAVWYRANRAIDERTLRKTFAHGADHPLHGIPRDSRGPLANIFICECCKQKMNQEGRNEGGYRCSRCGKSDGCWNKATALRGFTHQALGKAIGDRLLALSPVTDALVEYVHRRYVSDDQRRHRIAEIEQNVHTLALQEGRLCRLAKNADDPPASLLKDLKQIEASLAQKRAELAELHDQGSEQKPSVTRERIVAALKTHSDRVVSMAREAGATLDRLIPAGIRAVPYQQYGSNKVVLRAEFELRLINFLPAELLAALEGGPIPQTEWARPIAMVVDLFPSAIVPTNAVWAAELRPFLTLEKIGQVLGISKRQAGLAADLGDKMLAAGVTDPYLRLTSAPANASRWRTHAKFLDGEPTGSDLPSYGLEQASDFK